ncbi:MAG: hypothetical protein NTX25_00345 [Proteobacteria bacterium]|nr:hypothetical protein [Pseudomonadota bacterium]
MDNTIKRNLFACAYYALAMASSNALGYDAVRCATEQPTFRQICQIDTTVHKVSFDIRSKSEFRGYKFDIGPIIKSPKLVFETSDGSSNLDLLGLMPILEFDTNFTNLETCRQNTLWKDRIASFLMLPNGTERLASDVIVGAKHHSIELSSSSNDPLDRYITKQNEDGSQISIEATMFAKNLDDFEGRSASLKRIPKECQLQVSNEIVTFDPIRINTNLQSLKLYASTLSQTILKSTVLNGFYLRDQAGATCSIEKLSSTLYAVEGLAITDGPELLSLPSQNGLSDAISYAVSVGAISDSMIPKNDSGLPLYFEYYKNSSNRDFLRSGCSNILDLLVVKKENFVANNGSTITNLAAYRNALDYEIGIRNLKNIVDASWALALVAKKDVENSRDLEWLIDPKLYGFIAE